MLTGIGMHMPDTSEKREWLIKKGGYFYREKWCGYTTEKHAAGRYTEAEARREASCEPWHMLAIHQDEVPDDPHVAALVAEARRKAFDEAGQKAREYAAHYPEASDGRNTFIIFAEWAEGRP